jgi:hypothetical protein
VGHLNVVGDPLDELVRVLGLHTVDVVLNLLHGDLSSPVSGDLFGYQASHQEPHHRSASAFTDTHGQVPSRPGVGGGHQGLGVEQLLSQLRNGQTPVLLGSPGSQRSETGHEEMETGERNHVDGELPQVGVQGTGELEE